MSDNTVPLNNAARTCVSLNVATRTPVPLNGPANQHRRGRPSPSRAPSVDHGGPDDGGA